MLPSGSPSSLRGGVAPIRFEEAPPKKRRSGAGPIDRASLYDAMIVNRRIVPTRARMWHDYLNAIVWASFPNAKLALHERQHQAIEAWIPKDATRLPNARTRELDALALVDGLKRRGHRSAATIADADALATTLADTIRDGDLIVCLGAGDITKWAAGLAPAIEAAKVLA